MQRDLEPSNVMVARARGGAVRVRVLDYGIAKWAYELDVTVTELLEAAHATARATWPDVSLGLEDLAAAVADAVARLPPDIDALASLRFSDLYFARACLRHQPRALALLDARILSALARVLQKGWASDAERNDAIQKLRGRLLLGERPRLRDYNGYGGLVSWLRVTLLRDVVRERKRLQRETLVATAAGRCLARPGRRR